MKVMIVVTHLLGTGHLARALTLARAWQAAGDRVTLVSGGMPAPVLRHDDIKLVQLPPVRSDGADFSVLLDDDGQAVTDTLMAARKKLLLVTLAACRPDLLITELFPFGRRILKREFSALLEAATEREDKPLICASIRDILAPPSKPSKVAWADAMIARYYDAVLVHADPDVMPLYQSWPVSEALGTRLFYTGFVTQPAAGPHPQHSGLNEVLVSAGGGAVGHALFAAAIGAARLMPEVRWRLLVPGTDAAAEVATLAAMAPRNVAVETARPDFRQMLHHASVSVSLCGYNTALDVLQAGCPAVFVPYDAGNEVEQGIRARALSGRPGIAQLPSADLTADRLRDEVRRLREGPAPNPLTRGIDGAHRSVAITRELLGSGR